MKLRLVARLVFACLLAGCSSAEISARSGNFTSIGAPQPGTSVTGGSAGFSVQGGSAAAVVVTTGVIAAMLGAWRDDPTGRAVPEMLEGRAINEVDCTQPIADWSANIRCR